VVSRASSICCRFFFHVPAPPRLSLLPLHDALPIYPLGAFFRGEITLRQLRVLVENLPPDCASATRERGHDWTRRDYLAAEIADATRFLYALTASAYGANVPAPEPIERPGDRERRDAEEAERRRSHDQVRAQLIPGR